MTVYVDAIAVLDYYSAQHGDPDDFTAARDALSELIGKAADKVADGCSCDSCEALRVAVRTCGGVA